MHSIISPAILYWGTPVVLIATENEDGTYNIAPMSAAWWIGQRCMLGPSALSQTAKNMLRTKPCVLNLPSEDLAPNINLLARTTGTCPVPEWKASKSDLIEPPRILECPVQMEAEMMKYHEMMKDLPDRNGQMLAIEVKILRVHVQDELRLEGHQNPIDTDKWRPTLMMFQELYGMGANKLVDSNLAEIE